jgi:predicted nucleotidyltransferase
MSCRTDLRDKLPQISEICRRYGVRELSLFGSGLGPNFSPASDIDLLVEFQPDAEMDLIRFSQLRYELQDILGRKVDLVPKKGLKPLIRDRVLQQAELVYAG